MMESIYTIKQTIARSIKRHESINRVIEQNAALPALLFSVIEELFLTFRSYQMSLIFILLTPFSIFGIQHLMLGQSNHQLTKGYELVTNHSLRLSVYCF